MALTAAGICGAGQVGKCSRPVTLKHKLGLRTYGRDAKPTPALSFKSLFGPKISDTNKISVVCELLLHPVRVLLLRLRLRLLFLLVAWVVNREVSQSATGGATAMVTHAHGGR